MAAPPPHAGVGLITALNILEGYNITKQVPRNSTFHWIAEVNIIQLVCFGCQIRPGQNLALAQKKKMNR